MSSNKVVVKEFNLLGPNEVYLFDDVSQREALVQCLQVFRREKLLCDVSLRVNESKIAAHRNILSASSPYFKTLFLESETGKFIKNVPLPDDMSLTTTEAVLDYMYGGKVYLTDENCMDILKAASFFQLQSLTRECCYALVTFLTPENCLKIRDLALSLGQTELYERSLRFVWSNFADVVQQRSFLEVSRHTLEDLLSSDNIHVANELQVFASLTRWTEHNRNERGVHFAKILSHVRLPLLTANELNERVEDQELVQRSPMAKELLMEAIVYNSASKQRQKSLQSSRTRPRLCSKLVDVIVFVGGKANSPDESRSTMCYESACNKWYWLTPTRNLFQEHSITVVDGSIFACGGSREGRTSLILKDEVECFDTYFSLWDERSSMRQKRARSAAVEHAGLLYVVGGLTEGSQGDTCEVYNPINNSWKSFAAPKVPRTNHALISSGKFIYAIGGEGPAEFEPVISMERYDPSKDTWCFAPPMSVGKSGACAVEMEGKIYVIGGTTGHQGLRRCDVFDTTSQQWSQLEDLSEARQNAEAVADGNRIFVIGGETFDGKTFIESVECYNISANRWTTVATLPVVKHGFKCARIRVSRDHLEPLVSRKISSTQPRKARAQTQVEPDGSEDKNSSREEGSNVVTDNDDKENKDGEESPTRTQATQACCSCVAAIHTGNFRN